MNTAVQRKATMFRLSVDLLDRLKEMADIDIVAVVVIADLTDEDARTQGLGAKLLEEK